MLKKCKGKILICQIRISDVVTYVRILRQDEQNPMFTSDIEVSCDHITAVASKTRDPYFCSMNNLYDIILFTDNITLPFILSLVCVTIDGVLDLIYWPLKHTTRKLHLITVPSLISTLYKSLQHTLILFSLLSSPVVPW
jgi:hypothetical protein